MLPDIRRDQPIWIKAGAVVVITVVLTTCFIGVLSIMTGQTGGLEDRLPIYFLVMGVAFVVGIFSLTKRTPDAITVLTTTIGESILTLIIVLLAGEGVRYTLLAPDQVFQLQLLGYVASAGLIVTGLSYWAIKYWRQILSGDAL